MGLRKPDENVILRLDPDIVLWARMRALMDGTSMNRVVARLFADYAGGGLTLQGWQLHDADVEHAGHACQRR
jgi:hypothetical protein